MHLNYIYPDFLTPFYNIFKNLGIFLSFFLSSGVKIPSCFLAKECHLSSHRNQTSQCTLLEDGNDEIKNGKIETPAGEVSELYNSKRLIAYKD